MAYYIILLGSGTALRIPYRHTATKIAGWVDGLFFFKKNAMNKQDLAEKVQGVIGTTKADAERAVEMVIESIVKTLKAGDEVSIAGLGIFSTKVRPARTGRNPRTGESIKVPSMRVPKFRAAKALKDAVK